MTGRISRRQLLAGGATLGVGALAAGSGLLAAGNGATASGATDAVPPPLAKATGGNGKNVVLIMLETTRKDHVGAYGSSTRTPNLDAFARSGIRFDRAYPEMMPTIPVRRAIHTGRRSFPARDWQALQDNAALAGWEAVPQDQTTLAELLAQVGYTSLLTSANPEVSNPSMDFQRGFSAWDWHRGQYDDKWALAKSVPSDELTKYLFPQQFGAREESVMRQFLANRAGLASTDDWAVAKNLTAAAASLAELKQMQPFCLVVDDFEAHEPFLPPTKYTAMYSDRVPGGIEPALPTYGSADYLDASQVERMRALYAGEVTFFDHWIGRLFDELETQQLADQTLVVAIADHGIMLGEHGLVGKPGQALYPEMADIPLLMRDPDGPSGTTSSAFAGTHDVTPTILGRLGVSTDAHLDGVDLLAAGTPAARRDHATSMYNSALWVRQDDWWLIGQNYGTKNQLFDVSADPGLTHNVAASHPGVVRSLLDVANADAGGSIPHYAGI